MIDWWESGRVGHCFSGHPISLWTSRLLSPDKTIQFMWHQNHKWLTHHFRSKLLFDYLPTTSIDHSIVQLDDEFKAHESFLRVYWARHFKSWSFNVLQPIFALPRMADTWWSVSRIHLGLVILTLKCTWSEPMPMEMLISSIFNWQ